MAFQNAEHISGDFYTRKFEKGKQDNTLIVNMGPQHPSTHGVLRVMLEIDGEYILRAEPVVGYLHRMHEKMGEAKTWGGFYPNLGRIDYGHALSWNWAYCGAVERLMGMEIPEKAELLRVITCELNRLTSHLLWWGAYILDLGAFTPILYAFDDREKLLDILQRPTNSRLTYAYFRVGGVKADLDDECIRKIREFIPYFRSRLPMYKNLVTDNIILRKRIEGIGIIDRDMCTRYGCTGPVIRGAGVPYDLRRSEPYSVYDRFDFEVPTQDSACSAGRYLVRMSEMEQSLRIIEQALDMLPSAEGGHLMAKAPKPAMKPPAGEAFFAVEGGRGKVGVYVVSDGSKNPYRVKLRAPGYSNLHAFAEAAQGTILADAVAILGSLDLIIPEIDR
ncbi:NADH-quinone oxidoreductase subunit D [Pseudodesulfovibrio tunisiensis]|uniref:NADH-quinone oxidoreductase subunit D n=1 Tax=Pseudodesulfovibrio tunisiensis TaxID=463192 RepID=UPI001FB41BD2|nr:NADH-quinone oxidoreductase subunit D [Pseudodesulfovibrio tunisiensis]